MIIDEKNKIALNEQQSVELDVLDKLLTEEEETAATLIALSYMKEFFRQGLLTESEYSVIQRDYKEYLSPS